MSKKSQHKNRFMEKYAVFCDMVLLSCLFLLTCLPVVTAGAACSALYRTVAKVLMKEDGYLYRSYMDSFRKNLKQGILLTVLLLLVSGLCGLSAFMVGVLYQNGGVPGIFMVLRWLVFLPVVLALPWMFCYLSRFEDKIPVIIKNSVILGAANLPVTLLCDLLIILCLGLAALGAPLLPFLLTPVCRLAVKKIEPVLLLLEEKNR